ncbi:hypothetical protein A9Q84_02530 [Halobacteriovorax marinus]|uniref:Viral late gene transcription factor 3 zinc ribbon domain-containing protein n=1 Tax=Halobacteriovorax marinus TaxID=97084 RepID=A0A1Y5FGP0_9BACT|nr:hypothetical protein A9Q84_02530 [Halobacteriovorax marinus]
MSNKFDPQNSYEKLMSATNAGGGNHFIDSPEEIKVQIRPDKSVSPGKFLNDPIIPGGFKAHPTTIRAMRKDIFVGSTEVFADLEFLIHCESCKSELDVQFWHFCPFCEATFTKKCVK